MARISLLDHLQSYCFWLGDVAPIGATALPIFTPGAGFSNVTAPELTLETVDINEGNSTFTKSVIKRAEVSPLTLSRGATAFDADFWRWIMAALTGNPFGVNFGAMVGGPSARRTLLLVQFFRHSPLPRALTEVAFGAAVGGLTAGLNSGDAGITAVGAIGGASVGALSSIVQESNSGPYTVAARLPARAWLLYGCLPKRYKVGGDFDAMAGDVSIMELEIAVERFEEISLLA